MNMVHFVTKYKNRGFIKFEKEPIYLFPAKPKLGWFLGNGKLYNEIGFWWNCNVNIVTGHSQDIFVMRELRSILRDIRHRLYNQLKGCVTFFILLKHHWWVFDKDTKHLWNTRDKMKLLLLLFYVECKLCVYDNQLVFSRNWIVDWYK